MSKELNQEEKWMRAIIYTGITIAYVIGVAVTSILHRFDLPIKTDIVILLAGGTVTCFVVMGLLTLLSRIKS